MQTPRHNWIPAGVAAVLLCLPSIASACSVCFGDPEAPISKGIVSGIWVLLLIVLAVMGGIASFFVYMARRAATLERNEISENSNPLA